MAKTALISLIAPPAMAIPAYEVPLWSKQGRAESYP